MRNRGSSGLYCGKKETCFADLFDGIQVAKSATAQYAQGKKARKFTGPLEFLNSSTNVSAEKTDSMAFIISAMRQRLNLLLKDLTSSVGRFGRDPRDSVQDNLVLFVRTAISTVN